MKICLSLKRNSVRDRFLLISSIFRNLPDTISLIDSIECLEFRKPVWALFNWHQSRMESPRESGLRLGRIEQAESKPRTNSRIENAREWATLQPSSFQARGRRSERAGRTSDSAPVFPYVSQWRVLATANLSLYSAELFLPLPPTLTDLVRLLRTSEYSTISTCMLGSLGYTKKIFYAHWG